MKILIEHQQSSGSSVSSLANCIISNLGLRVLDLSIKKSWNSVFYFWSHSSTYLGTYFHMSKLEKILKRLALSEISPPTLSNTATIISYFLKISHRYHK